MVTNERTDRQILERMMCTLLGVDTLPSDEHRRQGELRLAEKLGVTAGDVRRWVEADRMPKHLRRGLLRMLDAGR